MNMTETASFVDPVFLARFGLFRSNVIDYFLHPLNPFRTQANTSNEVLTMQGISIGLLMQFGTTGEGPLAPKDAEEEYSNSLAQNVGEQYELMPPTNANDPEAYMQPSSLFTIRHVLRANPTSIKILGVYYVVEGVIYKAPSVRSLMKANVTKVVQGLTDACQSLSVCARFQPSTGYIWVFEDSNENDNENNKEEDDDADHDPVALTKLSKRTKRRKILDNRPIGERTPAEEEGIRASEAIDRILVRLSQNPAVTGSGSVSTTGASGSAVASGTASTPTKKTTPTTPPKSATNTPTVASTMAVTST